MSLRALVVDDSKTARIALKRSLASIGLSIEFAESGEGALEYLAKVDAANKPHVVFMDMMMPGIGGLKATEEISKNPDTQEIRIVMCSSNESDEDRSAAIMHGAIALISKPPIKEQLEDVLSEVRDTVAAQPVVEAPKVVEPVAAPVAPAPPPVVAAKPAVTQSTGAGTGELTAQVEQLVRQLTEQFVKDIAKNTANDIARTTAMNVASSTAKEITNETAKKTLPEAVEQISVNIIQAKMKTLPQQVQKWVDQRMNSEVMSEQSRQSIVEGLKPEIHAIIDEASAIAEDHAYEAAQEAVKRGIAPLKWGFFFLALILLSSIAVPYIS